MIRFSYGLLVCVLFCACGNSDEIPCSIQELQAVVGECETDTTYTLTLDFFHENEGNDFFDVYVRDNELFGYFPLNELPLTIEDFPMSGNDYDFIKVCINDNSDCCERIEFMPPTCTNNNECSIFDLTAHTSTCTSDTTYILEIDFLYENANNDFFDIYLRDNELLDFYVLSELPLRIEFFPLSGKNEDYIKICINDMPDCCKEIEFAPPICN